MDKVASSPGWPSGPGSRRSPRGGLRNAAVLENLAMLWIHLALTEGRGRDRAFKLVGR